MDVLVVSLLLAILLVLGYVWVTWNNSYWRKKGVFQLEPSFLVGNFGDRLILKKCAHDFDLDVYRKFEGHRFGGYYEFRSPVLWVRDPDLIKDIMVKSFDHFVDRRMFDLGESAPIIMRMVVALKGQLWRDVRNVMTPTFTSGKMKSIFGSVLECTEKMKNYLSARSGEDVEMKDVFGRFTMDLIAATAFGLQCDSFKEPNAVLPKMATTIMTPSGPRMVAISLYLGLPKLMQLIRLPSFDKEAMNFFDKLLTETIEYREKNGVRGNDYLQLLLDARKGELEEGTVTQESEERKKLSKQVLTEPLLIAQGFIFFTAGFETTASTLAMLAYELSIHLDIQEKVFQEVKHVFKKNGDDITYESLHEMKYLEMVLQETLRRRPPISRIERTCTEGYVIPGTDVTIEKGTTVIIPVVGIHMDNKYYPDPEKFDPERFSPEEKAKRHPYVNQSFGQGPRNCLGMRFAQMEIKAAAAVLVRHFRLELCDKTQFPLRYNRISNFLKAEKGIWLRLEQRT